MSRRESAHARTTAHSQAQSRQPTFLTASPLPNLCPGLRLSRVKRQDLRAKGKTKKRKEPPARQDARARKKANYTRRALWKAREEEEKLFSEKDGWSAGSHSTSWTRLQASHWS